MRARWKTAVTVAAIILFCLSFSYSFYRAAAFLGRPQSGVRKEPAAQRGVDRLGSTLPGAGDENMDFPLELGQDGDGLGGTDGLAGVPQAAPGREHGSAASQGATDAEDRGGRAEGTAGRDLYLGITGGFVTVFDGPPGAGGKVLEITDIRVDTIPPPEVQDLIRGVRVSGPEELLMILEGLGGEGERE